MQCEKARGRHLNTHESENKRSGEEVSIETFLYYTEETQGRNTSFFLNVTTAVDKTGVSWEGRNQPGVILSSLQGQTHMPTMSVWCVSVENMFMHSVYTVHIQISNELNVIKVYCCMFLYLWRLCVVLCVNVFSWFWCMKVHVCCSFSVFTSACVVRERVQ